MNKNIRGQRRKQLSFHLFSVLYKVYKYFNQVFFFPTTLNSLNENHYTKVNQLQSSTHQTLYLIAKKNIKPQFQQIKTNAA